MVIVIIGTRNPKHHAQTRSRLINPNVSIVRTLVELKKVHKLAGTVRSLVHCRLQTLSPGDGRSSFPYGVSVGGVLVPTYYFCISARYGASKCTDIKTPAKRIPVVSPIYWTENRPEKKRLVQSEFGSHLVNRGFINTLQKTQYNSGLWLDKRWYYMHRRSVVHVPNVILGWQQQ